MLSIYNKVKPLVYDPTIFNFEPEKCVAPYSESKYIVFSSCFFLIPFIYGCINNQYFFAITSLLTSIFSINYWRDAKYCYRRSCDLIIARISCMIYVVYGCYYTAINVYVPIIFIWYGLVLSLFYFYYMSCNSVICVNESINTSSNVWYKYHFMFHFIIFCGMMMVIILAINYEKEQQFC
jgi:hypothetical protein